MKNIFSFILAMCRIFKVGVGGFSHLTFRKIKVVLNGLKKTSCSDLLIFLLPPTSVLENKKTLGTRLGVFICLIVLLVASGKKGKKCKLVEPYNSYSQASLIRTPKGQNQVSALQRCPYYRGRECMIFGISGTKRTVRSREVSVL